MLALARLVAVADALALLVDFAELALLAVGLAVGVLVPSVPEVFVWSVG